MSKAGFRYAKSLKEIYEELYNVWGQIETFRFRNVLTQYDYLAVDMWTWRWEEHLTKLINALCLDSGLTTLKLDCGVREYALLSEPEELKYYIQMEGYKIRDVLRRRYEDML